MCFIITDENENIINGGERVSLPGLQLCSSVTVTFCTILYFLVILCKVY